MQTVLLGLGAAVVLFIFKLANGLKTNIAAAKRSGLPYIISPCSAWFLPWQITHKLWIPLITIFPESWWEPWLPPITPDYSWLYRYDHFAKHGDCYLIVSPGSVQLFAADAEVIRQITARREHFPKYTEMYSILNQFGHNVLTSEGHSWRVQRKVTSASFNERNAALVFRESIRQTLGMLDYWTEKRGIGSNMRTLEHDTMRWALNIIGYVGFGLRLPWPNEKMPENADPMSAKYGSVEPPSGYHFSFVEAMGMLLDNVLALLLVPSWLLSLIPKKSMQEAVKSREDYEKFITELLDSKIKEAQTGEHAEEGMDIMGQLVRSSYEVGPGGEAKPSKLPTLSRDEITGNAFIMLVAGHETTANATHFTLLEMASNPMSQRRLQRELDELLGSSDPTTWNYDELVNPLMAGMVGACLNETLRVLPSVIELPKISTATQEQVIILDGEKHVLPKQTIISLCAASVHMNPKYWPTQPSRTEPGKDDILEYIPERWFRGRKTRSSSADGTSSSSSSDDEEVAGADVEDYGGFKGRDTSAQLFRPERGAYIPFSDGPRSCLGRRIAQVEVISALAVLFREYSIELAVDDWASDEEVKNMDRKELTDLYKKAQQRKQEVVREARSLLTLKLRGQVVPVKLVKRGEEKFVSWMDQELEQI